MGYQNFFATRLFTDIGASDTTITLENPPTPTSGKLVLEARNTSKREIISYTGVSGNDITGVTRGVGGTSATNHVKNSLVEMNVVAEDLTDALSVPSDIITRFDEVISDHVASGLVWTDDTGLTADMSAGVAYINGIRLDMAAVNNRTFTASKDTYVDLGDNGVLDYNEVSNGASAPALAASHLRLARVVTDGSNTTSVINYPNGASFEADDGWNYGKLPALSSVVNNGQRNYLGTFVSDVSGIISEGNRVLFRRSVAVPTTSTDFESSSSQYGQKTTPTGISGITTKYTAIAWVYLEAYGANDMSIITDYDGVSSGFLFEINANGTIQAYAGGTGGIDSQISDRSVPRGRWCHVAVTMNVTTNAYVIMIDGRSVNLTSGGSTACTTITHAGGTLYVGRRGGGTPCYFDGGLRDVAIFNEVLTEDTIRDYMNQGLTGSETNCIGYFPLATDLQDYSSNNNDLTAFGGLTAGSLASSPYTDYGRTPVYDVALVTDVAGSAVTFQVPEGCTIDTVNDVTAVAHSHQYAPRHFVTNKERWYVESIYYLDTVFAVGSAGTYYNMFPGMSVYTPVGEWEIDCETSVEPQGTTAAIIVARIVLGTSSSVFLNRTMKRFSSGAAANALNVGYSARDAIKVTSPVTHSLWIREEAASGGLNVRHIGEAIGIVSSIRIIPAGL